MCIKELLATGLERPGWPGLGLAHLGCDKSGNIVTPGWLDVCDGAHCAFVMKGLELHPSIHPSVAPDNRAGFRRLVNKALDRV